MVAESAYYHTTFGVRQPGWAGMALLHMVDDDKAKEKEGGKGKAEAMPKEVIEGKWKAQSTKGERETKREENGRRRRQETKFMDHIRPWPTSTS